MLGFADSSHELKIYHILMIDHDNTQHGQINPTQISNQNKATRRQTLSQHTYLLFEKI